MRYAGMPFGMWALFAGSFRRQFSAVYGYDRVSAKAITAKAKLKYKEIIGSLPEFEKTTAELAPEVKNSRSHRGKALRAVRTEIEAYANSYSK